MKHNLLFSPTENEQHRVPYLKLMDSFKKAKPFYYFDEIMVIIYEFHSFTLINLFKYNQCLRSHWQPILNRLEECNFESKR